MPTNSCKFILITSCKGGVGKSTVTANLALALASRGKRVIAVDCDFSNRTLDLLFGCEDAVLYDLFDVMEGCVSAKEAILIDRRVSNLRLLPAPFFGKGKTEADFADRFSVLLQEMAEEEECDFMLIDTPGSAEGLLRLAASFAHKALIVAGHHPAAIRGAEKTGMLLDGCGVEEQYLVINRFDIDAVMDRTRPGINSLIDMTHTSIIGVIPEDRELELGQEEGQLYTESAAHNTVCAVENIAARLMGETVPLFRGFRRIRRRRLVER